MERVPRNFKSLICMCLVAAFAWCLATPLNSSARTSDDDSITSQVRIAIFQERTLRASLLNVRTDGGVVRLSGSVEDVHDVAAAEELARNVPGVVEVKTELVVVRDHTANGH